MFSVPQPLPRVFQCLHSLPQPQQSARSIRQQCPRPTCRTSAYVSIRQHT
jgi:hypothetical protein